MLKRFLTKRRTRFVAYSPTRYSPLQAFVNDITNSVLYASYGFDCEFKLDISVFLCEYTII